MDQEQVVVESEVEAEVEVGQHWGYELAAGGCCCCCAS